MARVVKVAAGVAARKGKAEKKIRTTNWKFSYDYLNISLQNILHSLCKKKDKYLQILFISLIFKWIDGFIYYLIFYRFSI